MATIRRLLLSYVLPVLVPAVGVWLVGGSNRVFLAALAASVVANLAGYWQGIDKGSEIASSIWKNELEQKSRGA